MPIFGQKLPWEQKGRFGGPNPFSALDGLKKAKATYDDTVTKARGTMKTMGFPAAMARRKRY
jgi:hypothetical protein